jgi:hypothetical protein
MSKHENHNHWHIYECSCHPEEGAEYELMAKDLHQDYIQLKSTVLDLLQSLEAEDQLKKGFKGMGYNIVTETASKRRGHIRRIKAMIGEEQ